MRACYGWILACWTLCLLLLGCNIKAAKADNVLLRGGGLLDGAVKRIEQDKVPYVVVEIDNQLKIAIPESQVARVAESEELAEYRKLATAASDDAEAHFELARWCKGNHLNAQSRHHLQRTLAIDPDHSKARAALGYVENDGKWIRHADLQKSRGLISVGGRFRLPEEVALVEAREGASVEAKLLIREVSRLRAAVLRGGPKGNEAMEKLAAIEEPSVAIAMAQELFAMPRQPQSLRIFWLERLAHFGNRPALEALVKAGVDDADSLVREKALEALKLVSPSTAIANYTQLLRSNDNAVVRRGAVALSYFPDPEMALTLVDALVTEHKTEIPAEQGTSVGFGGNGSGGMSAGGKAKVIITKLENPPVLSLLREIEPNVDFGYNQLAWRQHFAKRLSGYSGDLRRDL